MLSLPVRSMLGLAEKSAPGSQATMGVRYRVLGTVLVAPLTTLAGPGSAAAGQTTRGHAGPVTGYACVCDGAALVQQLEDHDGDEVVLTYNVERPDSTDNMFEIFQASGPKTRAVMAAPFTGAVPGTLLVAVTLTMPHLSLVSRDGYRGN
jgi:hypothetical protein